jgi:hypothetical protein
VDYYTTQVQANCCSWYTSYFSREGEVSEAERRKKEKKTINTGHIIL